MRNFLKIFLASFLSIVVFCFILFFLMIAVVAGLASKEKPQVGKNSVLVINLDQHFTERKLEDPFAILSGGETSIPGLYDVVRLIGHAKEDKNIAGIYLIANANNNGFASSDEIRNALLSFRTSKKFIIAHGDMMSQKAYFVATAADKVYANPEGSIDWSGLSTTLAFVKGTLDKLNVVPQIFYAGKFKSATEPFRTTQMTEENKLQTKEWLGDLYKYFLIKTSEARRIDTGTLHRLANTAAIQTTQDALNNKLIDGLKYDDQIKDEIKKNLGIGKYDKFSLVPLNSYADAANFRQSGSSKIALIYAEGNIIDGKGTRETIGSESYVNMIRKVRLDKSIKAVVFRINSGGGSALASENIWRELLLARREKPVVVSFGDVAASGGYYIGTAADSIYSSANTLTGSIGVFGIIPNMQGFFDDKLGVTFDGVKTADYADAVTVTRPLNEAEKKLIQASVDKIYIQFKQRVAQGRKKDIAYVDSIAQGRVWSGIDALQAGLVDKIGGLQNAIDCAARMANVKGYRIREYPEPSNLLNSILNKSKPDPNVFLKEQLGEERFMLFQQLVKVKEMCGVIQARLPFDFLID